MKLLVNYCAGVVEAVDVAGVAGAVVVLTVGRGPSYWNWMSESSASRAF